jgi:hypothetical protein
VNERCVQPWVGPPGVDVGAGVGVAGGGVVGVGEGVAVGLAPAAAKMLISVTLFHVPALLPCPR